MAFLPWVMAAAAVAQTAMSAGKGGVTGSRDKAKQFRQYTPDQMQAIQQLFKGLGQGQGPYSDLFGQFNPEQTANVFQRGVADPSMRNFQQRIVPGIMQNFADQGASSGLANSLASAGKDLQSNLGSQLELFMNQARLQQMQQRMSGLGMGLGASPYQTYVQQGNAGLLPGMLQGFSGAAGNALGNYMFTPQGTAQTSPMAQNMASQSALTGAKGGFYGV